MHHPTDRIAHTTTFVTPVVELWLEREIAQWVHSMMDQSDDPSHHERTLLPRSYISLLTCLVSCKQHDTVCVVFVVVVSLFVVVCLFCVCFVFVWGFSVKIFLTPLIKDYMSVSLDKHI